MASIEAGGVAARGTETTCVQRYGVNTGVSEQLEEEKRSWCCMIQGMPMRWIHLIMMSEDFVAPLASGISLTFPSIFLVLHSWSRVRVAIHRARTEVQCLLGV